MGKFKFNKEKTNQPEPKSRDKFQPPKLPTAWLASTFVAPVLVTFVPYLLSKDDVSFVVCLAIGLGLAVVLLIAFAFSLILMLYDSAYNSQTIQRDVDKLQEDIDELKANIDNFNSFTDNIKELRAISKELVDRIEDHTQAREENK